MKIACTLALCLTASLPFSMASAQVYQWKDSTGRTIISDTPPPTSTKDSRAVAVSPSGSSAAAPKTAAEKDMDFKKRQQESRQKAEKEAKDQAAAEERKENCNRAKAHLATLESGERLVFRDDNGDRRYMENAQREQEMERTRKIMAESCK